MAYCLAKTSVAKFVSKNSGAAGPGLFWANIKFGSRMEEEKQFGAGWHKWHNASTKPE